MKPQYRVRNWSEYNAGLKQRGSLTFWLEESILEQWVIEALSGNQARLSSTVTLPFKRWRPLKQSIVWLDGSAKAFLNQFSSDEN